MACHINQIFKAHVRVVAQKVDYLEDFFVTSCVLPPKQELDEVGARFNQLRLTRMRIHDSLLQNLKVAMFCHGLLLRERVLSHNRNGWLLREWLLLQL